MDEGKHGRWFECSTFVIMIIINIIVIINITVIMIIISIIVIINITAINNITVIMMMIMAGTTDRWNECSWFVPAAPASYPSD